MVVKQATMPWSTIQNGHLLFDGIDACEVAGKFGSPVILYSANIIRDNIARLKESFGRSFDHFSIEYAMKANPNPAILGIAREEGCHIDASSLIEIQLALDSGFPATSIMFTPNNVHVDELRSAVDLGVTINFDSLRQVRMLNGHLPDRFSCRVKLEYGRGEFAGTTTSGHGAKFGMTEEESLEAYRLAKESGVNHFGLHTFAGSNNRDPHHFQTVAEGIIQILKRLEHGTAIDFEYVDIGGGFGIPYMPTDSPLDLAAAAAGVHAAFKEKFGDTMSPELVIEPGRFLVGNSALLIGTVNDIKHQDANYLGTDIGMNLLLRPALYGAKHHIVLCNRMDDDSGTSYEVVGPICENTDRIASNCTLPEAQIGDLIAVFNAGAYVSSMSSNYNGRLRPAEILNDGGDLKVIRRRETYEDFVSLFSSDYGSFVKTH